MSEPLDGFPPWASELSRYLPIKTLFCLHGNIYDEYLHTDGEGGEGYANLREFLSLFLVDKGYSIVGHCDGVDGLTFDSDEHRSLFDEFAGSVLERPESKRRRRLSPNESEPDPMSGALDAIRRVVSQDKGPSAFVFDYASLLVSRPNELDKEERGVFLQITKASRGSASVRGTSNNLIILVAEKLNDIPPWLYLNNPMCKTILIERPEEGDRRRFFSKYYSQLYEASSVGFDRDQQVTALSESTLGMMTRDLESLIQLSQAEHIAAGQHKELVDRFKFGVRKSPWDELLNSEQRRSEIEHAEENLSASVKGQGAAIRAVVDILKRASQGLSGIQHSARGQRPKGVMFFAGPTGVGKTELAKALARLLFSDEAACIRFDMSEYSQPHADQRMFGAPPGYIGYEEGGQLTRRVKQTPFSILLFDEIEKAHPSILDKFLQILDDGRLTSGQGETVYFSECLLIFTSNKGIYRERSLGDGRTERVPIIRPYRWRCGTCARTFFTESDTPECLNPDCSEAAMKREETPYAFIQAEVLKAIEDYFKLELGRPEIYNRFGNNFIVFDYIRSDTVADILQSMLGNIAKDLNTRRGIAVDFSLVAPVLIQRACSNLEQGGRGVGNTLETCLVNPLARRLFDERIQSGTKLLITKVHEVCSGSDSYWELEWRKE